MPPRPRLALVVGVTVVGEDALRPLAALFIPLAIGVSKAIGLYDRDELLLHKTTLDDVPALVQLTTAYTLLTWLLAPVLLDGTLGRTQALGLWVLLLVAGVGGRLLAREIARRTTPVERCLLVADSATGDRLSSRLAERSSVSAVIVEHVELDAEHDLVSVLPRIEHAIQAEEVHRVILAPRAPDGDAVLDAVQRTKALGAKISLLPRVFEVVGTLGRVRRRRRDDRARAAPLRADALLAAPQARARLVRGDAADAGARAAAARDRARDQARVARPGAVPPDARRPRRPALRDAQVPHDGRRRRRAEGRGCSTATRPTGCSRSPTTRASPASGGCCAAPRSTSCRSCCNVLRGEMSLVGPRPLVVDEDRKVEGWHRRRLHLTPGHDRATGRSSARRGSRSHEMVKIDYLYVANWSLWGDVKILLRTVPYVLRARGM